MNIIKGTGQLIPASEYPASAVMYDHDGRVVWYCRHGTNPDHGGAISMDFLESNTVLMGPTNEEPPREVDLACNVIWEGPVPSPEDEDTMLTHHVGKLKNGNYLLLRWVQLGEAQEIPNRTEPARLVTSVLVR